MQKDLQFLLYTTPSEDIKINAVIKDETLWLTQKAMAELFGVQAPAINKHLKNIFEEGELDEKVVISKMEITTPHGADGLSTPVQTTRKTTWDYRHGRTPLTAVCCSATQRWPRTIYPR